MDRSNDVADSPHGTYWWTKRLSDVSTTSMIPHRDAVEPICSNCERAQMNLSEDELLVSRALAAGWTATVSEFRIPRPGFAVVWVWCWNSPNETQEPIEITVAPQAGLRPALDDDLRELFRAIEITSPNEVNPIDALADLLATIEKDLKWLVDADHRERVYSAFATAYAAFGALVPASIELRLKDAVQQGTE